MIFDAIVLAGGRSSRLGGSAKAALVIGGKTLLESTLAATEGAGRRVVVGDVQALQPGILTTREFPAFAGPASAIAAGSHALRSKPSETRVDHDHFTLVLACDMPGVADAVAALVCAAESPDADTGEGAVDQDETAAEGKALTADGVVAVDGEGRRQYLVGLYRTAALRRAIDDNSARLENLAVKHLLGCLRLQEVTVADGATADIDTWADAARFGISGADSPNDLTHTRKGAMSAEEKAIFETEPVTGPEGEPGASAETEKMAILAEWSRELSAALGIDDVTVDVSAVLDLAGVAAHAVLRPAAPLTTYLVGYSAGLAAAAQTMSTDNTIVENLAAEKTAAAPAFARAAAIASALAQSRATTQLRT